MTLQSTGPISFGDIRIELGLPSQAPFSLDTAENGTYTSINRCGANYPSSTNPASISEWYGYNHSAGTASGSYDASTTSCAAACALAQDCSINITLNNASLWYTNNICTTLAGNGITTYYADCARTNCYTVLNGSVSATTACTTTTTTTTAPPCSDPGQSCVEATDCCNYPNATCDFGICVDI